jgi:hypothetical protein
MKKSMLIFMFVAMVIFAGNALAYDSQHFSKDPLSGIVVLEYSNPDLYNGVINLLKKTGWEKNLRPVYGNVVQVIVEDSSVSLVKSRGEITETGGVSYTNHTIIYKWFGTLPSSTQLVELVSFMLADNREAGKTLLEKAEWRGDPIKKIRVFEKEVTNHNLHVFGGYEKRNGDKGLFIAKGQDVEALLAGIEKRIILNY